MQKSKVSRNIARFYKLYGRDMRYTLAHAATSSKCDILVIGITDGKCHIKDKEASQTIKDAIKNNPFGSKQQKYLLLPGATGFSAKRVLLVAQENKTLSPFNFRAMAKDIILECKKAHAASIALDLESFQQLKNDPSHTTRLFIEAASEAYYHYHTYKNTSRDRNTPSLPKFHLIDSNRKNAGAIKKGAEEGFAIADAASYARDLGYMPPNDCTPSHLANEAKAIAKSHPKVKATVLDEAKMKKLGMNALLAVGQGSDEPSKCIIMEYQGHTDKKAQPIVLVGKGITFDTGGINLKPSAAITWMKLDMCGAASMISAFRAACQLQLPINLVCIIASAENMPSAKATRPSDIVETLSGQTVEILNTDAEGRLVLCDALTYAERFNPKAVVNAATLTGAIIVALGHHMSGVFSNDQNLANDLLSASEKAADPAWQMPINEHFDKLLDSDIADIKNIPDGAQAGSVTAACYLSRFTKNYPWAHLDVAGTAMKGKEATGRVVPMLVEYLIQQSNT